MRASAQTPPKGWAAVLKKTTIQHYGLQYYYTLTIILFSFYPIISCCFISSAKKSPIFGTKNQKILKDAAHILTFFTFSYPPMVVNKALEKKKNSIMETKRIKEMTKEERKTLLVMKIQSYIRIVDTSLIKGDAEFASMWFDDIKYTSKILQNILDMEGDQMSILYRVRFT